MGAAISDGWWDVVAETWCYLKKREEKMAHINPTTYENENHGSGRLRARLKALGLHLSRPINLFPVKDLKEPTYIYVGQILVKAEDSWPNLNYSSLVASPPFFCC